jgi:hypothetical protein
MAPYAGRGARGLMLGQETVMRMVQPRPEGLDGTCVLPPMRRVEQDACFGESAPAGLEPWRPARVLHCAGAQRQ